MSRPQSTDPWTGESTDPWTGEAWRGMDWWKSERPPQMNYVDEGEGLLNLLQRSPQTLVPASALLCYVGSKDDVVEFKAFMENSIVEVFVLLDYTCSAVFKDWTQSMRSLVVGLVILPADVGGYYNLSDDDMEALEKLENLQLLAANRLKEYKPTRRYRMPPNLRTLCADEVTYCCLPLPENCEWVTYICERPSFVLLVDTNWWTQQPCPEAIGDLESDIMYKMSSLIRCLEKDEHITPKLLVSSVTPVSVENFGILPLTLVKAMSRLDVKFEVEFDNFVFQSSDAFAGGNMVGSCASNIRFGPNINADD